jgi:chromosome segregation ATPase
VGAVFVLVAAFLLFRLRREGDDFEDEEESGGSSGKNILRLKAQVETLAKEKGELEVALKEKNQEINRLQEEKVELEAALESTQTKSQENFKTLEEMEKKLAEAEQEAQGFRQEYMALYARNQQEKESLKKT